MFESSILYVTVKNTCRKLRSKNEANICVYVATENDDLVIEHHLVFIF